METCSVNTGMKNRIRTFLILRKQNDTVKMICIFALAGILSFASALYHAWEIYHYTGTPADYILASEGSVTEKNLAKLLQDKEVAAASPQRDISLMITFHGTRAEVNCTLLSQEYMEEMLDRKITQGTKRIYMNETAFLELWQSLPENNADMEEPDGFRQADGDMEFDIRYSMPLDLPDAGEDSPATAESYKTAKLVVAKTGMQEEGFICMAEKSSRLSGTCSRLRIRFARHDLDGLHVKNLRKSGYSIENEEAVVTEEYGIKIKLLHIQYGFLSFAVCLMAVLTLQKFVRSNLPFRHQQQNP